jgi:HlyD family secretion protein
MRVILILVLLAALGGGAFFFLQSSQPAAAEAVSLIEDEVRVETKEMLVTVSGTGPVSPARQVGLVFELNAPVSEILVQEGQPVRLGDVLARLDVSDLQLSVQQAQLNLDTQQATYDALIAPHRDVDIAAAEAAVQAAQAQLAAAASSGDPNAAEIAAIQAEIAGNALWQAQLARDLPFASVQQANEQAAELGLPPPFPEPSNPADNVTPAIENAADGQEISSINAETAANRPADVAGLSAANAQLVSAQVQLDRLINGPTDLDLQIATINLDAARTRLAQAQAALSRGEIVAPFDGVIARSNLVLGEAPPTNQPAFELIDTTAYFVDVSVDETDIVQLQVGQEVTLRFDALPETRVEGVVTRVAQTPTRQGQLVTYLVRVELSPTLEPVRAGMTATTTIVVNQLTDALVVPNRFIRIDRTTGGAFVTIEPQPGVFEEIPVTLGVRNETESQIISGLEAGQRVVLLPRGAFNPIDAN